MFYCLLKYSIQILSAVLNVNIISTAQKLLSAVIDVESLVYLLLLQHLLTNTFHDNKQQYYLWYMYLPIFVLSPFVFPTGPV